METKKLRLKRTTEQFEDVEVTFPIYRRHPVDIDAADIVRFSRVNADGSTFEIVRTWCHHNLSYEIEIEGPSAWGEVSDYTLGRGEYASSREEFEKALAELNDYMKSAGFMVNMVEP